MTFWSISISSFLLLGLVIRWRLQHQQFKQGLGHLSRLHQLIMLCQQHRATSNDVVSDDQCLRPQLLNKQQQINSFIKARQSQSLARFPQWHSFVHHCPRHKQSVFFSNQKSFLLVRQHNLMIERQLSLIDDACRYNRLYHLMLNSMSRVSEVCPDKQHVGETIGKMRAIGSAICSGGRAEGADEIVLKFLHHSVQGRTVELMDKLKAVKYSQLCRVLNSQLPLIRDHVGQSLQHVERDVLGKKVTQIDATKFFSVANRPINAVLESFNKITQYAVINYAKFI